MAKKKTQEATVEAPELQETVAATDETNVEATVASEVNPEETEQVAPEEAPEKPAENKASKPRKAKAETELPAFVKQLLALYPQYEELYIDSKGGVFVKETQPNLREGAILYQNPYYKQ